MDKLKEVEMYTDGGCRGNPGIGGWCCILIYKGKVKELSGYEADTTNNRMELTAVIKGLSSLKEPCKILLYSDSKYVCDGIGKWLENWKKRNWLTSQKKPVLNKDLWELLSDLLKPHSINCQWLKGHNGHTENERADTLANDAMDQFNIENNKE